jgi:hypothetical protein
MASSLIELNALLDNFIPLTKKVSIAKDQAMQKEAEALEKIPARVETCSQCGHVLTTSREPVCLKEDDFVAGVLQQTDADEVVVEGVRLFVGRRFAPSSRSF